MNTTPTVRTHRSANRGVFVATSLVVLLLMGAGMGRATDITTCGETVAAGDTADLQADLDCQSGFFGVRLLARSTLRLNGHSIVGGPTMFATILGVAYVDDEEPDEGGRGNFTIIGPGEIAGAGPDFNFFATTNACVTLQDGRATLTSPTGVIDIHGCNFGIVGYILEYSANRARATIDHVVLHDNSQEGITVRSLTASNVTAYGNGGTGVNAIKTLVVNDVISHDNRGHGVYAGRTVTGTNVTVTGNYNGVSSNRRVTLTYLSSTGNVGVSGVQAPRVKLTDSVVTGNNSIDILASTLPQLVNTTCGTSGAFLTATPWGVCTDD